MRTSLGLQGYLLMLAVVGSVAVTFGVPKPRLLWSSLLAAVCGFCAGRLYTGWYDMLGMPDESFLLLRVLLLFSPPVVLGAALAWRLHGRNEMAAGWLGIPYGAAAVAGMLSDCGSSDCGEPVVGLSVLIATLFGAVLAIVGAALTVALRALTRRLRS